MIWNFFVDCTLLDNSELKKQEEQQFQQENDFKYICCCFCCSQIVVVCQLRILEDLVVSLLGICFFMNFMHKQQASCSGVDEAFVVHSTLFFSAFEELERCSF